MTEPAISDANSRLYWAEDVVEDEEQRMGSDGDHDPVTSWLALQVRARRKANRVAQL
jgi:hypothetical protein